MRTASRLAQVFFPLFFVLLFTLIFFVSLDCARTPAWVKNSPFTSSRLLLVKGECLRTVQVELGLLLASLALLPTSVTSFTDD
jgi:hypothetical protein